MTITGSFKYSRALVLSPERLSELDTILQNYSEHICYEAITVNNSNVAFQSKDELLAYDNYGKRRIKGLTIIGYRGFERVFRIEYLFDTWCSIIGYLKTVKCYYSWSGFQEDDHFQTEVFSFLRKATPNYWWLGKVSTFGIMWLTCSVSSLYKLFSGKLLPYSGSIASFLAQIAFALLMVMLFILFDRHIIRNVFPPIVFAWGEEIKRVKKYDALRSNILWCIIVAILVGLFTAFISDKVLTTLIDAFR